MLMTVIGPIPRECTEKTLSHRHRLERESSSRSESGDDNKYLYELQHSFFYGTECQGLLDSIFIMSLTPLISFQLLKSVKFRT